MHAAHALTFAQSNTATHFIRARAYRRHGADIFRAGTDKVQGLHAGSHTDICIELQPCIVPAHPLRRCAASKYPQPHKTAQALKNPLTTAQTRCNVATVAANSATGIGVPSVYGVSRNESYSAAFFVSGVLPVLWAAGWESRKARRYVDPVRQSCSAARPDWRQCVRFFQRIGVYAP